MPLLWGWGPRQQGFVGKTNTMVDMDAGTRMGTHSHTWVHTYQSHGRDNSKKWPHLLTCICFLSCFCSVIPPPFLARHHYKFVDSFNWPQWRPWMQSSDLHFSTLSSAMHIPTHPQLQNFLRQQHYDPVTVTELFYSTSKAIHAISSVVSLWFKPSRPPHRQSIT